LVAGIDPQVRKAPKAIARWVQQQPDAVFVGHLDAMDPRFDDQAFGIHQQVALSAFHLLGGVEAALLASHCRGRG
jgi:hypothetical protein